MADIPETPKPVEVTRQTSKFGSIDWNDALHGAIIAVGGAVLEFVLATLQAKEVTFDLENMGKYAAVAGISYILKKLAEPSKTVITFKPAPEDRKNEAPTSITKSEALQTINQIDVPKDDIKPRD